MFMTYCRVSVFRVATINDDVPSLKKRNLRINRCSTNPINVCRLDAVSKLWPSSGLTAHQLVNEVIHSLSSLDQQDDPPGLLELGHHVFQRFCSNNLGALSLVLQEVMHLGHGTVVSADLLERY